MIGLGILIKVEDENYQRLYDECKAYELMLVKQEIHEYAYAQGQADAMKGELHIQKIGDDYEYISSPWNDGKPVIISLKGEIR
tara:strand:- start:934 stop:1182 length:249 start_codon:yes stop_codon:yes gene_type:complete